MLKTIATLFGIVFIIVGILGFIPTVAPGGMLLGYFHVNALHNLVHIVTGLIALWAASGATPALTPRLFFQVFGIVYGVVAIYGYVAMDMPLFGVLANNLADAVLHSVIAIISLYFGFVYEGRDVASALK